MNVETPEVVLNRNVVFYIEMKTISIMEHTNISEMKFPSQWKEEQ